MEPTNKSIKPTTCGQGRQRNLPVLITLIKYLMGFVAQGKGRIA